MAGPGSIGLHSTPERTRCDPLTSRVEDEMHRTGAVRPDPARTISDRILHSDLVELAATSIPRASREPSGARARWYTLQTSRFRPTPSPDWRSHTPASAVRNRPPATSRAWSTVSGRVPVSRSKPMPLAVRRDGCRAPSGRRATRHNPRPGGLRPTYRSECRG